MDQRQDGPLKYYMKHYNSRFKKKKKILFWLCTTQENLFTKNSPLISCKN